jgi:hypothetical protein
VISVLLRVRLIARDACSARRFRPALPADQSPRAAFRADVAARDQARWLQVIARKDDKRARLYSRPGNDFTHRFPLIVETLARLRSRRGGCAAP